MKEWQDKAAVYCISIGFSLRDRPVKKVYHYASVTGDPVETIVRQINAYLVDAPMIFLEKRLKPLRAAPEMNLYSGTMSPLAVLYNPVAMLPELLKAHQKLDRAVEAAYGRAFDDDSQRAAPHRPASDIFGAKHATTPPVIQAE